MAQNCVAGGIVDSFDLAADATLLPRRRLHYRIAADEERDYCNWPVQIVDRRRFVVVHQTVDTVGFVGSFDFDSFDAGCMGDTDGNFVDGHDYCPRLSCQMRENSRSRPHFLAVLSSFLCITLRNASGRLFIRLHTSDELQCFGCDDNSKH